MRAAPPASRRSRTAVRTHRTDASVFDVPDGSGGFAGVMRDGPALVCVLTVSPPAPSPVVPGAAVDLLPLDALALVFAARDARPDGVDVAVRTLTCWGDGPAALAYLRLLGPVAPASHRSVTVIVRVDPSRFPDAVALRGGGPAGALRTALWCVRRVAAALATAGVATRVLAAAELTAAGPIDAMPVVARLRADGVEGQAPPMAGARQKVGASESGDPVSLRIAGPSIRRTELIGDVDLARLTVLRAAAIGIRTRVHSERPERWRRLVDRVGDAALLSMGRGVPADAQLLVDDCDGGAASPPGLTVLSIHRRAAPAHHGVWTLRQDPDDPGAVHLVAPGREPTAVRSVIAPAERELIGPADR